MKRLALAALLLAAAAAPGWTWGRKNKPTYIDLSEDEDRNKPDPRPQSPERRIAEIQRRMENGDLPKIQFEFDEDVITLESYPTLELIREILLENPKLKLMVLAHTCTIGTEAYNLDLSQRRAKSVKAWLTTRNIPPPSIRYRGLGYSMPIADNSTEEGRERNRRVEFRVTFRDWPSVY